MTNPNGTSKNERRQHARELAKKRQVEERRRRLRNRIFLQGGLGLGILAILAIIIVVIVNTNSGGAASVASAAGPKNMATDGIQFAAKDGKVAPVLTAGVAAKATPKPVASKNTDGSTKVVTYIDWACPVCKQFEASYSSQILDLVAQGKATLEIHPVSILDRNYQSSRYASRAANAAACVANYDPDDFLAVQTQFYDNQPEEGSTGLTNAQIKALVKKGGAGDAKIATCIDDERFKAWVTAATNQTLADPALQSNGSFGTPTVVIDGKKWDQQTDLLTLIGQG